MSKQLSLQHKTTEFLLYTAPNGAIKVEVLLNSAQATQFRIWATQLIKEFTHDLLFRFPKQQRNESYGQ